MAADLDIRQRELAAAVEARALTLAQLPRLSWAVATDEETVRDLTPDELGFRAQPGEMIAVAQIDKASGRAATLLRVPATTALQAPMDSNGPRWLTSGNDLLVASVVAIEPREHADAIRGALIVARRLDVEAASDQLIRAGIAARLLTPDGAAAMLTVVPALERQPPLLVPIGAPGGLRLEARLPRPRTGMWIAVAIFVLLIWGTAAAVAARRADAAAAGLRLPGMTLPPPADEPSDDTTPMHDLIIHERNRTASSNGYHDGQIGAAVAPVVEVVSGPMTLGVAHSEAHRASSADLHALFREFIDLRQRCGDHSQAPSYEQFTQSLQQRRAELLEAHAGTDVSFQIVFIDGRAVVRAKAVG
ncbi:MAG TPA: MXAN_5187 C-terminal domain-containing protein [Polyangia bacterium]|nr:MXAN_5187 C-terminal domain-containing protein [Polyangia bacterium]